MIEEVPGLGDIAQRFRIRMILQFGSTVTGTTHARSDLDLAIKLDRPNLSLQTILEIQEALQTQFPGHEIDLAILNRADPLFLKKIVESCRILFGTAQDFARLRLYAFKSIPRLSALLGAGTTVCRPAPGSAGHGAFTPMIDRLLITRKMSLIL